MPSPPRAFFTALALSALWLGCGSETEQEDYAPATGPDAERSTSRTDPSPGGTSRPPFDAGFDDDAGEEPAPAGEVCVDDDDPGGSETTAKELPATNDSQNSPLTVSGVLAGPVDVDFYKLAMADESFALVQPDFQLLTNDVEMCVFVQCKSGATTVSGCGLGSARATSPVGTEGCCATGPAAPTPTWDCPGLTDDDSALFTIRLSQSDDKCTPYAFSYRF